MNAKIIKYNIDTGKTIEETTEQVIVTLGEYPEEMPVVSINTDVMCKKNENINIQLNIEELQKAISLNEGLKWLQKRRFE